MATSPDWLPDRLTSDQRDAVLHTGGPLLVAAGPGAGKTQVMVFRTVHLVRDRGVDPGTILVTTFTEKAADELFDRLYPLLGHAAGDLHISTLHSFCQSVLEDHPRAHPWGAGFQILDGREQFLFVYGHLKDLDLSKFPKKRKGDFVSDVVSTFNLCTEEAVSPSEYVEAVGERGAALLGLKKDDPEAVEEYRAVAEAYSRYLTLLREEGLLDFGMLQRVGWEILRQGEAAPDAGLFPEGTFDKSARLAAGEAIRDRFRHVMVDEYQDTNRLQVEIVKAVAAPEFDLCAVGDDDQSIYGFRGASVKSFLRFEEDFRDASPERVDLDVNFRSTPPLVEAASSLIEENEPERMTKRLRPFRDRPEIPPVVIHRETSADEAEAVVRTLEKWKREGAITDWSEVTLLLRSVKSYAGPYLEALEERGIPYQVAADGGFFDRDDIDQLKRLITFCGWKRRWQASILDGPLLDLSTRAMEAIGEFDGDPVEWEEPEILDGMGLGEPRDRRILRDLGELRRRTLDHEFDRDLLSLFYRLINAGGYFDRCCNQGPAGDGDTGAVAALLNLAQFSNLLDAFHRHLRSTNTYLLGQYLRSLPYRHLDDHRPEPEEEAVEIMTVHQAKGLEFPVVVVGAAMQNRFPGRYRPRKFPVPGELKLSGEQEDESRHYRDERRLFYVGMTRAQDCLVVGTADKVRKRGGGPSQFLDEIDEDLAKESVEAALEARAETGGAPVRKRVSYSAIHSYLLCPLQYWLIYEAEFAVPEHHYFAFGRLVHRALEELHRRAAEEEEINRKTAEDVWDDVWNPGRSWSEERTEELEAMGRRHLVRYVEAHADRFERVRWVEREVELPLEVKVGPGRGAEDGIVITGRLDLACEVGGAGGSGKNLEIIDFKVRSRQGLDILRPDLQVETYGLAAEETEEEEVDRVLLHLLAEEPGEDVVAYDWSPELTDRARDRLEDAARGILEERFEPTPGLYCRFCDFRELCPASRWRKDREDSLDAAGEYETETSSGSASASAGEEEPAGEDREQEGGKGNEVPVGAAP